eukprot:CAMPEP_0168165568 /NCGR_PEP_ID=MMETSP0139_2-20121125/1558_1 /TAXON_ID=44445 /ORGANISM="Pseudo-nitzschia australis, Strain 10249 10 AB" /LENGTH=990 /DNA_ID=CAMNT_0008082697 /DNA_START=307 /DNA_END=3276 /DNA_ORIENTATION=-
MSKQMSPNAPITAETTSFGMRKATFCFLVACLFGNSSSLSSQPHNRMAPKPLGENVMKVGANEAEVKTPGRTTVSDFSSSRNSGLNQTLFGATVGSQQERASLNEPNHLNGRKIPPGSLSMSTSILPESFRQVRNDVIDQLRENENLDDAKMIISGMIEYLKEHSIYVHTKETNDSNEAGMNSINSAGNNMGSNDQKQRFERKISLQEQRDISEIIDEALQAFFARAFAPVSLNNNYVNQHKNQKQNSWHRVALGIELLQLQLGSSDVLVAPYHNLPKSVIVKALAAVTRLQESRQRGHQQNHIYTNDEDFIIHPDTAFRLLQRLATGVGVRNSHRSKHFSNQKKKNSGDGDASSGSGSGSIKRAPLYEVDFNRVLNIYSSTGKMEMAHRVIALQERTPHAPALSPVTYSILVKGYGKLCDSENIDVLLRHASATEEGQSIMKPDTIFFNSLMDAYINCRQLHKAQTILMFMIVNDKFINGTIDREFSDKDLSSSKNDFFTFPSRVCPSPNLRSYNILLKGYAREGLLEDALNLAEEMRSIGSRTSNPGQWWDHVTTNTLVQAAVAAKEFAIAQEILDQYTLSERNTKKSRNSDHPNADAYTTLMDGFAKDGKLKQAISLLKTMKEREVEPNEYHYSCLIGSLARKGKIEHAEKMLVHVKTKGSIARKQLRVIYNAYISGLVQGNERNSVISGDDDHDNKVNNALTILREMIEERIMPDANTIAIILDGFGHCLKPRMKEAMTLVEKLETQRIIPTNHIRVTTALVRVCGSCHSLDRAIICFRRIPRPDVAAINALIDAAVRSGNEKVAVETFNRYFAGDIPRAVPNVISFSILIGAHIKKGTFDGSRAARELYQCMRFQRRILPDKGLVDIIAKGMVDTSRTCGVQASDARFVAGVLRDAEKLDWEEGQLDRRKMLVESAMNNHVANAWEEEAELYGLWKKDGSRRKSDDNSMFERHGWNKVDSGFRLWGPGKKETERTTDDFLESKGW